MHRIDRVDDTAESDETQVRLAVRRLNEQIRQANFAITWGPPSTIGPLDVEEVVARWRAGGD